MKITANVILSDIRNLATSGSTPTDFRIEDAQTLFWIDEIGSMLKSQAIQKRQDISDVWIQQITCLELIEVDKSECCEVSTNCKILRTNLKIPNTIEFNGDNLIIRVEKPNGEIISKITSFASKYNESTKYGKKKAQWYLKNSYIYIINEDLIENINIYGIFESPSELAKFISCNGNTCYNVNSDYPCSMKMAEQITSIILKTKVYPFIQLPQDTKNDGSDAFNSQPNPKQLK